MQLSVVTPYWQDRAAAENLELATVADRLGYPELWMGEMATYDAFAFATAVGLNTEQIHLAIGPLAVSVRTPMTIAMGTASVASLTGRTTNIALGASSHVVVREWHGKDRARTATHMDETARIVRALLNGEKANLEGQLASCKGYRLRLDVPESAITIAAFTPAAVRAAARRADRMLLNMVTSTSVALLHTQLREASEHAGKPMPRLAVWLPTAVNPTRESIDQLKRGIVGYLAAPGYSEMIASAGFSELVELARTRPHPKEVLHAMPDELIATIGLLGSESEVAAQLAEYEAAGADEVCIVPATAGDDYGERTLSALS